jgi:hypothetical protein
VSFPLQPPVRRVAVVTVGDHRMAVEEIGVHPAQFGRVAHLPQPMGDRV